MKKIKLIDIDDINILFPLTKNTEFRKLKKVEKMIKENDKNIILSTVTKKVFRELSEDKKKKLPLLGDLIDLLENDKSIYKNFLDKILKVVIMQCNLVPEEQDIFFLANENTFKIQKLIEKICDKYKMINIVTTNMKEFAKLENENIIILNNKKKSLKRAKFIINIDFNEKDINEFFINREAKILNISSNKIKNISGFDGIIINNINIVDFEKYQMRDIYVLNRKEKTIEIEEKIKENEIDFIGNNGIINLTKQ